MSYELKYAYLCELSKAPSEKALALSTSQRVNCLELADPTRLQIRALSYPMNLFHTTMVHGIAEERGAGARDGGWGDATRRNSWVGKPLRIKVLPAHGRLGEGGARGGEVAGSRRPGVGMAGSCRAICLRCPCWRRGLRAGWSPKQLREAQRECTSSRQSCLVAKGIAPMHPWPHRMLPCCRRASTMSTRPTLFTTKQRPAPVSVQLRDQGVQLHVQHRLPPTEEKEEGGGSESLRGLPASTRRPFPRVTERALVRCAPRVTDSVSPPQQPPFLPWGHSVSYLEVHSSDELDHLIVRPLREP